MHTQVEKVCTAIFCLPAIFFLDFVKICVRPQGCVFPGTLCIVAEKRWSVEAQPPSLAKEPQCTQNHGWALPCSARGWHLHWSSSQVCGWGLLFVYIICWWGSSIESKICKLLHRPYSYWFSESTYCVISFFFCFPWTAWGMPCSAAGPHLTVMGSSTTSSKMMKNEINLLEATWYK